MIFGEAGFRLDRNTEVAIVSWTEDRRRASIASTMSSPQAARLRPAAMRTDAASFATLKPLSPCSLPRAARSSAPSTARKRKRKISLYAGTRSASIASSASAPSSETSSAGSTPSSGTHREVFDLPLDALSSGPLRKHTDSCPQCSKNDASSSTRSPLPSALFSWLRRRPRDTRATSAARRSEGLGVQDQALFFSTLAPRLSPAPHHLA